MSSLPLVFTVTESAKAIGWKGICFRIDGLHNRDSDPRFTQLADESLQKILSGLTLDTILNDPILQGFKQMHETIAHSNRETSPAPESLLKILLRHRKLPQINLLVNIYNLISVETRLALGAHDIEHISGNVVMRLADGNESFYPIGATEPKPVRPGDYAYIDSSNEVLCWLEVKQVEKTKVTLDTTHCFYIIQGNPETDPEYLKTAADRLITLTKEFCGGTETFLYTPELSTNSNPKII